MTLLSPQDDRDLYYRDTEWYGTPIPDSVDLRAEQSPVRDQGRMPCCAAFACCGVVESHGSVPIMSPMHLYYYGREKLGRRWSKRGVDLRTTLKVVQQRGCIPEVVWPYNWKALRWWREPPRTQDTRKCGNYYRITDVDELLSALASPLDVVGAWTLTRDNVRQMKSGRIMSKYTGHHPWSDIAMTHAMGVVGYDKRKGTITLKNSFGTSTGYVEMRLNIISSSACEMWAVDTRRTHEHP